MPGDVIKILQEAGYDSRIFLMENLLNLMMLKQKPFGILTAKSLFRICFIRRMGWRFHLVDYGRFLWRKMQELERAWLE